MPSHLKPEAVTTTDLDCPACRAPMAIIDRFTLYGVPEPVEHVKVRCAVGHWCTIPTEWLASPDRNPHPHDEQSSPRLGSAGAAGAAEPAHVLEPAPGHRFVRQVSTRSNR